SPVCSRCTSTATPTRRSAGGSAATARPSTTRSSESSGRLERIWPSGARWYRREPDRELGPAAGSRGGLDAPAHRGHELLDDRQAEPRAGRPLAAIPPVQVEPLERVRDVLRVDSRAGVADGDRAAAGADRDRPARGGHPQGVLDQVRDGLEDPVVVAEYPVLRRRPGQLD